LGREKVTLLWKDCLYLPSSGKRGSRVIVTSIFPFLEMSGVAISIPFSLFGMTCVFTDLGTLGRDGVTSGREGRRSWSHLSYIIWEERK